MFDYLAYYLNSIQRVLWNEKTDPLTRFQYSSRLQGRNIRLVKLKPGKGDDCIECMLLYENLDNSIPYTALSYVWGDPQNPRQILCDGQPLNVTRNLFAALWRLRELGSHDMPDILWIDAICINQSDSTEKTAQVRLMQDIYSNASLVLAWLGEAGPHSAAGLELIDQLQELYISNPDYKIQPGNLAIPGFNQYKLANLPDGNAPAWDGLLAIIENPWFRRVWIVQELLLARRCRFLYGATSIASETILTLGRKLSDDSVYLGIVVGSRGLDLGQGNAGRLSRLELVRRERESSPLLLLLVQTLNFRATEKRDRVFALMALACDGDVGLIDYGKDVSEVLIQTARYVLSRSQTGEDLPSHFIMLSHAQLMTHAEGTPSWVPNWTCEDSHFVYNPILAAPRANGFESVMTFKPNNILQLRGKIFDRITAVYRCEWVMAEKALSQITAPASPSDSSPFYSMDRFLQNMLTRHANCLRMIQSSLRSYPTGQPIFHAYWHSLVFDNDGTDKTDYADYWHRLVYTAGLLTKLVRSLSVVEQMGSSGMQDNPGLFGFAIGTMIGAKMAFVPAITAFQRDFAGLEERREVALGRWFCITEGGYAGWMAPGAEVKDEVCVFEGWDVPFVVRRQGVRKGEEKKHVLVGDCYLHGHMSPEKLALQDIDVTQIQLM